MKKLVLLSAVALMSASVFVSCGPSEEEKKKMEDSLAKMLNESFSKLGETMTVDTAAAPVADTTAAPAGETK